MGRRTVAELLAEVARRLARHFGRRSYRPRGDPLAGLVRTVLSQNTTDLTSERAYRRLRRELPSWSAVLAAPRRKVEAAVRVSGLAGQKAGTIRGVLARLRRERGRLSLAFLKKMPANRAMDWLTASPGVGTKTAAVVLLFDCGKAVFPVDTHVRRVAGRIGLVPEGAPAARVQEMLAPLAPRSAARCAGLHLDMIRLGRRVCGARGPECRRCPLLEVCRHARRRRIRRAD